MFSPDGSLLYLPEYYENADQEGKIIVRDALSLEPIRELPSHGFKSHNVMLLEQGDVLVVGHQGTSGEPTQPKKGGCLSFISTKNGELMEKMIPEDPYLFMSHFDVGANGKIIVSAQNYYSNPVAGAEDITLSSPLLMGSFAKSDWHAVYPESIREKMRHNHTVVVDKKRDRALVAHMHGNIFSIWDLSQEKLIRHFDFKPQRPYGIDISADGDFYVMGTAKGNFYVYDAEKLTQVAMIEGRQSGIFGYQGAQHLSILPNFS